MLAGSLESVCEGVGCGEKHFSFSLSASVYQSDIHNKTNPMMHGRGEGLSLGVSF